MRSLTSRLTEWYLSRHLPGPQVDAALGDLAEDFAAHQRTDGRWHAALWLLRESASLVSAYRVRIAGERWRSRRTIMGETWMADTRLALRRLMRRPAATLASIVVLACGVAGAAVAWSLLSTLLLNPVPLDDADRLFVVETIGTTISGVEFRRRSHVYTELHPIRESALFDAVAAGGAVDLLVSEGGAVAQPRTAYFVTHDFFATLGLPLRGAGFHSDQDARGAELAAVLADGYWRRAFNADPEALGRTIEVSGRTATIVGITPPGFRGLNLAQPPDLYLPLHTVGEVGDVDTNYFAEPIGTPPIRSSPTAWLTVVGRLPADTSATAAATRMSALWNGQRQVQLVNIQTAAIPEVGRPDLVQFTRLLAATVGLLLLIGAVTVGMLLLVRTEARRNELAMCLALGGTRLGLARGIAIEGALLTIAGVLLSVPVAYWGFGSLSSFALPGRLDMARIGLALDSRALAATLGAGLTATLLMALVAGSFGLTPNVASALRARSGGTTRLTGRRLRAAIVAGQVAVAVVLLTGAGVFARSLATALSLNPGFDAARILTVNVSLRPYGYTGERASQFFERFLHRIGGSPTIDAAAVTRSDGGMTPAGTIVIDGIPRQFPTTVTYRAVDDRYFAVMGMRVAKGRTFQASDTPNGPRVVLVSESLAREIARGGDPIGRSIGESSGGAAEIIGVVPDVITNVADTSPLVKYYSLRQRNPAPHATLVLRTNGDTNTAIQSATAALRSLDPLVTPAPMLTIADQLRRQMSAQDLGIFVLGGLGTIATLLTLLGAYVVADSMSAARRREYTIRRALGATRLQLGAAVLTDTTRLVGIGILAGLLLAWLGAGTIRAFLFRVEPLDPAVLLSVSGGILVIAILVSLRPAMESARVDVTSLLRDE